MFFRKKCDNQMKFISSWMLTHTKTHEAEPIEAVFKGCSLLYLHSSWFYITLQHYVA